MTTPRTPIHQRFWACTNSHGHIVPHAVSYHRPLAIKRFVHNPDYGFGKTWKHWKRRGWSCVRVTITPHTTAGRADSVLTRLERKMAGYQRELAALKTAN